jgi:hypothetical protein
MNPHETAWLRKIILLSIAILTVVLSVAGVKPALAQVTPTSFDAVDAYISTQMQELGIPRAALVIVHADQIGHLKAFGVADAILHQIRIKKQPSGGRHEGAIAASSSRTPAEL